jgi:hypothetical protein
LVRDGIRVGVSGNQSCNESVQAGLKTFDLSKERSTFANEHVERSHHRRHFCHRPGFKRSRGAKIGDRGGLFGTISAISSPSNDLLGDLVVGDSLDAG